MDTRIWVIQHQVGGTSMRHRELACGYGDQRNKGSALSITMDCTGAPPMNFQSQRDWHVSETSEHPTVTLALENPSLPLWFPVCSMGAMLSPYCTRIVRSYVGGWTIQALLRLNKVREDPTGSGLPDSTVHDPLLRTAEHGVCSPAHEITEFEEETRNTKSFFHFEVCSCLLKARQNSLGSVGNMNPIS